MTDDAYMRVRLQQVVAYRQLCESVRRTGRTNVFFALIFLFFAYELFQLAPRNLFVIVYGVLALAELGVGLYKWMFPSAEGVLLDGLVLLLFVASSLGRQVWWVVAVGGQPQIFSLVIGVYLLLAAVGRFKNYLELRRVFAERPSREQLAWFDELIREIRSADPESDDQALDLPTRPRWKAKLLGTTAFFVAATGGAVWVAGPGDFEIAREPKDHGTGRRRALLTIHGQHYPEFDLADASWANYQRWLAANTRQPPANPHP